MTRSLPLLAVLPLLACPSTVPDDDDVADEIAFSCTDPEPLPWYVNSEHSEMGPSLSADGLTLYFSSDRPGTEGSSDIWFARRDEPGAEWGEPENLGAPVNTGDGQNNPAISPDDALLVFGGNSAGDYDLWSSAREGDGWGEPQRLDALASDALENKPAFSWDGDALYFKRSDDTLRADIWVSQREGDGWGEPQTLPGITDGRAQTDPAPSPDGEVLFFVQGNDTSSAYDVFFARWNGEAWAEPRPLDDVSVDGARDEGIAVGPDGAEFFLVSNRDDPNDRDLYTFVCDRSE